MSTERTDTSWQARLIGLPRYPKRTLLVLNDFVLLTLAMWLAFSLRLNTFYLPPRLDFGLLLLAAPLIGVLTFFWTGLYKLVTRFISPQGTVRIFLSSWLAVLIWLLVVYLTQIPGTLPRTSVIMYAVFSGALIWASRQLAGWVLRGVRFAKPARFENEPVPVIIYGAGTTGVQLAQALKRDNQYRAVGFVDENRDLWRQNVAGVKVYRPSNIGGLIQRYHVREIFLAIPQASRRRRRTIVKRLERFPTLVKTLPAMEDIASGRISTSDLRHISTDDLLGRDPVPPDERLLEHSIAAKAVMVTGAGGSIGSELTRQILQIHPTKLILVDVSEASLYLIQSELEDIRARARREERNGIAGQNAVAGVELVGVLGSVLDAPLMERTIRQHGVQTIFHAAAYKHVPIVEANPSVGLRNNILGTKIVAEAARDGGVESFVLISTDKAVRPTNVMGASKRIAELVLQAMAKQPGTKTIFTMVRFGNVLDSSGSVVKLFRNQIAKGGPVTVTHKDIVRYFMSIPEAAQLVIQAGAMAEGGDVFVLDMGQPVRIDDLAHSMIRLMGLTVRNESNPSGDIQIDYTGLRPGEKLYEELLIGDDTISTHHPRIRRSREPFIPLDQLQGELSALSAAIATDDAAKLQAILLRTVEGFTPDRRLQEAAALSEPGDEAPSSAFH